MFARRTAISLFCWLAVSVWIPQLVAVETEDTQPTVKVVIDFGDGVQKHFTALPWQEKMTVLDALLNAQKHPRGIKVQYRGKGPTAFVSKIDDLENQGRGSNWIYRVNDKLADRGCGVYELKAGDTILWKFGEYR